MSFGAFKQNNKQAHPNSTLGLEHQCGSHLGPANNPLEQGDGEWAGPGCGRTAPSSVQPHLAQAVHSMLVEAVACGAFLKYEQTDLLKAYKGRSPLHIQERHIEEEEGLHTFH